MTLYRFLKCSQNNLLIKANCEMTNKPLNVLLLAGGVGGAKMAEGLQSNSNIMLTILGNIGDDDSFHGLWVSPDIDTMIYTLSEEINRKQGWGVRAVSYTHLTLPTKA